MTSRFNMTSCSPPPSQRGLAHRRTRPRQRPRRSAAANGTTARRRPRWPSVGASGWRTEKPKVPWVKLGKLPTLWQLKQLKLEDSACILKTLPWWWVSAYYSKWQLGYYLPLIQSGAPQFCLLFRSCCFPFTPSPTHQLRLMLRHVLSPALRSVVGASPSPKHLWWNHRDSRVWGHQWGHGPKIGIKTIKPWPGNRRFDSSCHSSEFHQLTLRISSEIKWRQSRPAFCTPKSGHQFHSWDVGGYLPELVGKSSKTDLKICQQKLDGFYHV